MKKNIIYIHSHDTGRYIQPYGYAVPTPRLMQLAEESVLFRHAYSIAPTCSPSRSGLLTGMYPHSNGMLGLAHRGFRIDDYSRHLARYLSSNGYETALSGVQHEAAIKNIELLGYEQVWREKGDQANAELAAKFIKSQHDRPFFLSFGMFHTHKEYPVSHEGINANYVIPAFPQYDNQGNREEMARYMASARIMDGCVGVVLDAIKEAGLEHSTIVMYTTDHGIALPNMKCSLYDTGIGVSLMMKFPGNPMENQATDALVSQLDVFPTLCDIAGVSKPEWLQGRSLLPVLEGHTDRVRDEIFAEVSYHASYEPMRCIRTERYKLIKRFDDHDGVVPANIDGGIGKEFLIRHGLLRTKVDKVMLFDLYFDPTERDNVAMDPEYQEIYKDLYDRLEDWMVETNDPLLQGKVTRPEGARVNKLSCIDPTADDFE